MLSQRQRRQSADKNNGNQLLLDCGDDGAAALNDHNDLPAKRLATNGLLSEKSSPLSGGGKSKLLSNNNNNKANNSQVLNGQHLGKVDSDGEAGLKQPLISKQERQQEQQSRSDTDQLPSALVRANSLNTNSTGERSKYEDDDEDDDEEEEQDDDDIDNENELLEGRTLFQDHQIPNFSDQENDTESPVLGDERETFIKSRPNFTGGDLSEGKNKNKRANLAKQESVFEQQEQEQASIISTGDGTGKAEKQNKGKRKSGKQRKRRNGPDDDEDPNEEPNKSQNTQRSPKDSTSSSSSSSPASCCSSMFQFLRARRCLIIPLLLLVIYCIAIYCLPFIKVEPKIPNPLPSIPFDFDKGPLRPSSASAFKATHLFKDQLHGPESLAFDSLGNCYTAIEGGFVLYAHLNKSSPIKRSYLEVPSPQLASLPPSGVSARLQQRLEQAQLPELIKIADLNGMRQVVTTAPGARPRRDNNNNNNNINNRGAGDESATTTTTTTTNSYYNQQATVTSWRRECQLDEKIYGPQLYEQVGEGRGPKNFKSNVRVSRCSKPLGVRLNHDESSLYVIDTLSGLYRVNLKVADKPFSMTQRQVTKLIDFKANNGVLVLPAIQLEDENSDAGQGGGGGGGGGGITLMATRLMNVSLKALDDLVIDHVNGHDLIYMTVASQQWPAVSFLYDALEGRPSGLVLRYDTSNNLLAVLEPGRLAHVRASAVVEEEELRNRFNRSLLVGRSGHQPSIMMGAPRLDENDIFDDRPLNFPNGLELTNDGQALLIADTTNKRIIRHYVRGPRRGTSDLWAWTPMYPDNIRRGFDKQRETYWVVGCGKGPAESKLLATIESTDPFALLRTWPRVRKFLLKNIYFFGYLVESIGANVLKSTRVQDAGYELRTGSSLCSSSCSGMMIIQYNQYGDILRSIHSREFPNDLHYYSQVNELIDPDTHEHSLYLGSPSYNYLTRLVLPTESHVIDDEGPPKQSEY